MVQFLLCISAVIVVPAYEKVILLDFDNPICFDPTEIYRQYYMNFNIFHKLTCSSSCIVAARGRPSATLAIIVIRTILEILLSSYKKKLFTFTKRLLFTPCNIHVIPWINKRQKFNVFIFRNKRFFWQININTFSS